MPTVSFPSLPNAEVIELEFLTVQGGNRLQRLLVDTGFTGGSSVILGKDALELVRADLPSAQTSGALQGSQNRGWVTFRLPGVSFERTVIAIITDLRPLSLPTGIHGMVGLTFLRLFPRWGAEQAGAGWQFVLSIPD